MKKKDEIKRAQELAELADRLLAGQKIDSTGDEAMDALVETLFDLMDVTDAPEPDPAFQIRARNLAMAALPKPQEKPSLSEQFQAVLARLLGEEDFRKSFFANPEETVRQAGFQLSPVEMAALKEMEPENLQDWMGDLDERISKSGFLPDD
jgi:hypothetical protein